MEESGSNQAKRDGRSTAVPANCRTSVAAVSTTDFAFDAVCIGFDETGVFDKGLPRGLGEPARGTSYSGRCVHTDDHHDVPFLQQFQRSREVAVLRRDASQCRENEAEHTASEKDRS